MLESSRLFWRILLDQCQPVADTFLCWQSKLAANRRGVRDPHTKSFKCKSGRLLWYCARILVGLAATAIQAQESIMVEGIAPRNVYTDQVSFLVAAQPGYDDYCWLDGKSVPANVWVAVSEPNYHELCVRRKALSTGIEIERTIPFILRSSQRGNSEWGLPPLTPYPTINSASAELDEVFLRLVYPTVFPLGLPIPIAAFLESEYGEIARLNGAVNAPGFEQFPIQMRRGSGSVLLPPAQSPGLMTYAARLSSLTHSCPILIETNTSWTRIAGAEANHLTWPENSRIWVTNNWQVPVGTLVEIGSGSVIKLSPRANIVVAGRFAAHGTTKSPIVFTPESQASSWGGFIATNRTSTIELTGSILTGGGGDPQYFPSHFGISHRTEQPLFVVHNGARASLTNCCMIDNAGQAGNGYWGIFVLDHCLVQRCQGVGEFEGGSVSISDSALIEFPVDSPEFADEDQDALYLVQGFHTIKNTVIGWAKDDGLDAGSGYASMVTVSNCWIEACYHEGLAWSGGDRVGDACQTVIINCGQAIETGFSLTALSPIVYGDSLLCLNNGVGARFGDNYDWVYSGWLRLTNSFFLYNQRDVWGMNWQDWSYRSTQMDVQGSYLTEFNPWHTNNVVWRSTNDGWRLAAFRPGNSSLPVGIGIATYHAQTNLSELARGIPVGLSCFSTNPVAIDYSIESTQGLLQTGTLAFQSGEMVKLIPSSSIDLNANRIIQVVLSHPQAAEITGRSQMLFVPLETNSISDLYWLRSRDGLILAWASPTWILEDAETVGGLWRSLAETTSPVVVPVTQSARFFRLRNRPSPVNQVPSPSSYNSNVLHTRRYEPPLIKNIAPLASDLLVAQMPPRPVVTPLSISPHHNPDPANLVWIPGGSFLRGSPSSEIDRDFDEGPNCEVAISHGFYIRKCEVTQREYLDVMGNNPSFFRGDLDCPVEQVSWFDAVEFCERLTAREAIMGRSLAGFSYRLPTEAEWEYACRAGQASRFSHGDDTNYAQLGNYAWNWYNSGSASKPPGTSIVYNNSFYTTHRVGQLIPNLWGLFDTCGNVWEWCLERYGLYPEETAIDPQGPIVGHFGVIRGGSWYSAGKHCRSANRNVIWPDYRFSFLGFRPVLAPDP